MPLGNKEIGFYDENYFDSVSQANRSLSYIQEVSELLKMLRIRNNLKILDLGCGTAEMSYYVKKRTKSTVIGVDFSDFRKKYLKNIIPFKEGNSESIPFEDNSLDVVLCIHSIAHFDRIKQSLNEIYRTLKKGGILGIITPNKLFNYCYLIPNKLEIIKYTKDKTVNYPLSFRDMKNVINESKFDSYKIRHVGDLPEFLNYKIIPKNFNYINLRKRIIAKLVKI